MDAHARLGQLDSPRIVLDPSLDLRLIGDQARTGPEAQALSRLQTIYEVARQICEETSVDGVIRRIVPALSRLIPLERCFVALLDPTGRLHPYASFGIELGPDVLSWPVSTTILDRVLGEGLSILTLDALGQPGLSDQESVKLHGIRSVLAVPLGSRRKPLGLIYVDNRLRQGSFSETDLQFVTALAQFCWISLRNATELERAISERVVDVQRWGSLQSEAMRAHQIVGSSAKLREAYERLQRVASREVPVLLIGETGTGKEVFARALHKLSPRESKAFIAVNVVALAGGVVESELFGHERGAFTGATSRRIGRFELAHGGTLFLDEIGEIPLPLQAKLLRVLETGEFERVGGHEPVRVDVRLVCATHRDLLAAVRDGKFREDLYYRIHGVQVDLPPLRERNEDVPDLVELALKRLRSAKRLDPAALRILQRYAWPGNARQLLRVVEELDAVTDGEVIRVDDLPGYLRGGRPPEASGLLPLRTLLANTERQHIAAAIEQSGGSNERAAELLGVSRSTFFERKRLYDL